MRVGIVGYTGFVGRHFLTYASAVIRYEGIPIREKDISVLDLTEFDALLYLAGIAHVNERDQSLYYKVNCELALQVAARAKDCGVPHFIYMSSTKVYGQENDQVLTLSHECLPTDPYGKSKLEAEQKLFKLNSFEFVVTAIRPCLIYGPYVKGNMKKLLEVASLFLPAPIVGKNANRSVLYIGNLLSLTDTILRHKAGGIFLASDREPISSFELMRLMRKYLKKRIPPFSSKLFEGFLKFSVPQIHKKLFGSFIIDSEESNKRIGYYPPFSTEYGIRETVSWFKTKKNASIVQ